MRLNLTNAEILSDIESFEQRIQAAKDKLRTSPAISSLPYNKRPALNAKRHALQAEIYSVAAIIKIAEGALDEQTK